MKNKREFTIGIIIILTGYILGIHTSANPTPIVSRIFKPIKIGSGILNYSAIIWLLMYYIGFRKVLRSFGKEFEKEGPKITLFVAVIIIINLSTNSYITIEKIHKGYQSDVKAIYVDRENSYLEFEETGGDLIEGSATLFVENMSNNDVETYIKVIIPERLRYTIDGREITYKDGNGDIKAINIPKKSSETLDIEFYVTPRKPSNSSYSHSKFNNFEFTLYDSETEIQYIYPNFY